jgi:hypothetical protein
MRTIMLLLLLTMLTMPAGASNRVLTLSSDFKTLTMTRRIVGESETNIRCLNGNRDRRLIAAVLRRRLRSVGRGRVRSSFDPGRFLGGERRPGMNLTLNIRNPFSISK